MEKGSTAVTQDIRIEKPFVEFLRVYIRNPAGMLGFIMLCGVFALTFIGPFVYPVDPFEMVAIPFSAPLEEGAPLFGTDQLGRDLFAGMINGARATLTVGAVAALLACVIGIVLGALGGFYGGLVDASLARVTEFFQVLPPLLFAMVIVALFSPTLFTVSFAIGITSWPSVARITRAEFLKFKNSEFVAASRAAGATNTTLIWRIILPNAIPPLVITATLTIATAILFESGLSFLGLSDPNVMSWGLIIGNGRENIFTAWWIVTIPGFAVFFTVLAVSLVGDGLNDALNPKLRRR